MNNPVPHNEKERLRKLHAYKILDSEREAAFDNVTELTSKMLNVPICLISLIDEDRQWFKSKVGLKVPETSRDIAFCQHTIMGREVMQVENACEDERFKNNPLVQGEPYIRFYAGAPLIDEQDIVLGTLCVIDRKARSLSKIEKIQLSLMANMVTRLIRYRKSEHDAFRLAKVKEDFLVNINHELRTPLNGLNGFANLLKKTSLSTTQKDYLDSLTHASDKLSVLINNLLDISQLDDSQVQLEEKPVCLQQVMNEVAAIQSAAVKDKKLRLLTTLDTQLPELLTDKLRLLQVLVTLLDNAIKYTEEGHIELKVTELSRTATHSLIQFSVRDTGIGMTPEDQEAVGDLFTQANSLQSGTGSGLYIVKKLLELFDSQLQFETVQQQGSCFTFTLNLRLSPSATEPQASDSLSNKRILIVEDDPMNQLLAQISLEQYELEVDIAENGEIALQKLMSSHFDAVLMDLQMPVMDGITATEKIRQDLQLKLPVIACSANSKYQQQKEKCLQAGMNGYISKPYTAQELISCLESHLLAIL